MEVIRFADEYEMVAPLLGRTASELQIRDERRDSPVLRWMAIVGAEPLGVVTATTRPDNRTFLQLGGDVTTFGGLAAAVRNELGGAVYTMVDESDERRLSALRSAGFETEMVAERFRIRFVAVLQALRREWVPPWLTVAHADEVDEGLVFALDNELRQDVPGTEGWEGNREWFRAELAQAPPFDRDAYLVAIDRRSGEYAGLVRIWRNAGGPRFGLIGVRRQYRRSTVAGVLIRRALTAAGGWGYDDFVTETSLANTVMHPRMAQIDAASEGRFHQLVRYR